ncbi:chitinase [Lentisphaerota bacterium ZTH]|nr:chitinase [Lentisphaerota bacterium]WET07503.1 chitinase [Lentisphaerota bacterium ZTH]
MEKVLSVFAACLCGLTFFAPGTVCAEDSTDSSFPTEVFAPYVDTCDWPIYDLSDIYEKTGQKYYTLAFVVSDSDGQGIPTFGGYTEYSVANEHYMDQVEYIRGKGGDVIVSFGGAINTSLASAIDDVDTLADTYQYVVDTYSLKWIDFDIETDISDTTVVDRRNQAIKILQDNNPDLQVSYTLPVMPSGLTDTGLAVISNALENGVRVDCVNIMTMDYGIGGDMGENAIEAMDSLHSQLEELYEEASQSKDSGEIWAMIGATPMIGQNDVSSEYFSTDDAEEVLEYATENNIKLLSMWSVNNDDSNYSYTTIFDQFTSS